MVRSNLIKQIFCLPNYLRLAIFSDYSLEKEALRVPAIHWQYQERQTSDRYPQASKLVSIVATHPLL